MDNSCILKIQGVCKEFTGVKALRGVNLSIKKGTVHALMGENGAGKSTLMKILIGIYHPDAGVIYFDGEQVVIRDTNQALSMGISMIHQELNPVMEMTVSDNIFLGREPINKYTGIVNDKILHDNTQKLFESLGIKGILPRAKMKELSIAQVQMVEIAKAISYNSKVIIMDEPTSAITDAEVETLFRIIDSLRKKGISIIYISHKMDEIFRIADEITVFRDGEYIGTERVQNVTMDKLISMMVGRELKDLFHKEKNEIKEVLLEVKNLSRNGKFKNVSFKVHRGEILGIAGLMGSGRTEIVETIFGMYKADAGEIYKNGNKITIQSECDAIKHKIALVTEDRKALGLALSRSIKENISISWLDNLCKWSIVQTKLEKEMCDALVEILKIKIADLEKGVGTLSGGNQQKVVIARWLMTSPDILIMDEPTRGIDIGAKTEIYNIMTELARSGKAIIMISSEMPELLGMSDRIIVVHNGVVTGELGREEATQEKIMYMASS